MLTDREWGIVMRCLMNCENSVRNSLGDSRIGEFYDSAWRKGQIKRADAIRTARLKLRAQRKAAK